MLTNAPGLQCYSGNYLDGSIKGKGGVAYPRHGAFALETQVTRQSAAYANGLVQMSLVHAATELKLLKAQAQLQLLSL